MFSHHYLSDWHQLVEYIRKFADMVLWIIINNTNPDFWVFNGKPLAYHYVDDFFGGFRRGSDISWWQYKAVIYWFDRLGIPTKSSKCKEPSTSQVILGFLYNTIKQMVFIPPSKNR